MTRKKIIVFIKAIVTILLFFATKEIQYFFLDLFGWKLATLTMANQIILSLCANLVIVLLLVIIYFNDLKKEMLTFLKKPSANIDIGFKYWIIGIIVMFSSNVAILLLSPSSVAGNEVVVQKMIASLPWVMLINTGFLAPIIEEIAFRKTFYDTINNKKIFVIVSGFMFGLLHVIFSYNSIIDLLYIIPYGALGCAFAMMYKKTDSIFTSILFHSMHNTILTLISILTLILK